MKSSPAKRFRLALVALAFVPAAARAQTDVEINAAIEFDFLTPGARSMAMGGAFVALADDATAAFTNPAGLTALARPEVSLEVRHQAFTHEFTNRGHGFGPPTGEGVDSVAGIVSAKADDDTDSLSYASLVLPGKGWCVGVYRHQLGNLRAAVRSAGAFLDTGIPALDPSRLFPVEAALDLEIENYGVSFAAELGQNVSVGAGLSYYNFQLDSVTRRFGFDPGGFFAPAEYDLLANFQTLAGDDDAISYNVGVLWRASDQVGLGAVYRRGPEFDFLVRSQAADGGLVAEEVASFHVPDVFAVGLVYRPLDDLTLSFDYDFVRYSNLTEGNVSVFAASRENLDKLRARDANEVHFGGEYVFSNLRYPLALRGGVWRDPDHRIAHARGDRESDPEARPDAVLFREGDDAIHATGGAGLVLGSSFQLDAAFDLSDRTDLFSVSGVYRF